MSTIYIYRDNTLYYKDVSLIDNYKQYEIEKVKDASLIDFLNSYNSLNSDGDLLLLARVFVLGDTLDAFLNNGLLCIEKGLKVVFKNRFGLSFHRLIDYNVFTTKEQQKTAFSSVYSVVMPEIYTHKMGRKRTSKEVNQLRNYWLNYIYHNSKAFKGSLTTEDIIKCLNISTTTLTTLKKEIAQMLLNGDASEIEQLETSDARKESKKLETFKERLTKVLSSKCTQLDLFASDEEDTEE